jgi:uncharacterized membrane protein (DUF485 family)
MAVSEETILDKLEKSSFQEEFEKELEVSEYLNRDKNFTHRNDLEKLLILAEDLKKSCDEKKTFIKRQKTIRIVGIFTISVLIFLLFLYLPTLNIGTGAISAIILAILGFAVSYVMTTPSVSDAKRQYLSDKLALTEVLQLLRETSDIIAEKENWSVLSRAEFRIRLSRFNLEEKSESDLVLTAGRKII